MLIPPPLLAGAMSCDCQAERGGGWKSQVGPWTKDRRASDTTRTGERVNMAMRTQGRQNAAPTDAEDARNGQREA